MAASFLLLLGEYLEVSTPNNIHFKIVYIYACMYMYVAHRSSGYHSHIPASNKSLMPFSIHVLYNDIQTTV